MKTNQTLTALALIGVSAASACGSTEPSSGVRFKLDAPFCSGTGVRLDFSVDGARVGEEVLKHGEFSSVYPITTGPHSFTVSFPTGATLQQWTVTISDPGVLTETIELYCS